MVTVASIKNEIHVADCSDLNTLKSEADSFVASYPTILDYAINHWYREYNRRKYLYCGGADMISPFDAGFRPIGYLGLDPFLLEVGTSESILLEDGTPLLLE